MNDLIPKNSGREPLKKGGIAVLLVIAVAALLLSAVTRVNSAYSDTRAPRGSSPLKMFRTPREYLAAIHIEGVIEVKNKTYDQGWLLDTIADLASDQYNIGIVLVIDSPGGTVYEADAAYLALCDYKAQTGRPVYAYMQSLAASGGYYIACAADRIFANRNTLTGSIGVIAGSSIDITELLEKYGVKYTTFTAGRNKNMGNLNSPLTSEQRAIMQSLADECYDQFTKIVADSRKMDIEKVRSLADGRIYSAKQAYENGLIDGIYRWDEMLAAFDEETESGNYELVDYCPEEDKKFMDYLMDAKSFFGGATAATQILPESLSALLSRTVEPSYLYTGN